MKRILRVIIRFSVLWFFDAIALLALHEFVSGITLTSVEGVDIWVVAMSAALILAVLNTLVRPVLILLTAPINVFTLGFFALFVNAGMLILASYILPYFQVSGLGVALWGAFIMAVVNTLLTSLIRIDDDYSFFYGVIQWLSKKGLCQRCARWCSLEHIESPAMTVACPHRLPLARRESCMGKIMTSPPFDGMTRMKAN